jgi:hypothetical protein
LLLHGCKEKITGCLFIMENKNQAYQVNLDDREEDIISSYQQKVQKMPADLLETTFHTLNAQQNYWLGIFSYYNDFTAPYWTALNSFLTKEKDKINEVNLLQTILDYMELYKFNMQIAGKSAVPVISGLRDFHVSETGKFVKAFINSLFNLDGEEIKKFSRHHDQVLNNLINIYPQAIKNVEKEFGFHFDDGGYLKVAETARFTLYQVSSRDKSIKPNKKLKPIIILPPYVLGPNILGFLPDERKSYTHAYADQGIPTYIRIMKDVAETPALQTMTGDDDARDTRYFCEIIKKKYGKMVTLNGFCQGGFISVINILSGALDDLVDVLITCVSPMDGTKSKSLVDYLQHVPERFRDLGYAQKVMPNGNKVVDGKVMSWVYKLKSMESEAPMVAFNRDLASFEGNAGDGFQINKTATALNHWLIYDRNDLPVAITQMSFDSYTTPVSKDGVLPIKLFGKKLNFKRIKERGIKWLLCYAQNDDLVDKEAALAPLQFVDAEVTVFPKGHGAMATSWSHPDTECALHKRFGDNKRYRGPVRFQLDMSEK